MRFNFQLKIQPVFATYRIAMKSCWCVPGFILVVNGIVLHSDTVSTFFFFQILPMETMELDCTSQSFLKLLPSFQQ